VTGMNWMSTNEQSTTPWPTGRGYGDDKDRTWTLNGTAHNGVGWISGLPAAALRGGAYNSGDRAGAFAIFLSGGPSYWKVSVGARCCRQ